VIWREHGLDVFVEPKSVPVETAADNSSFRNAKDILNETIWMWADKRTPFQINKKCLAKRKRNLHEKR